MGDSLPPPAAIDLVGSFARLKGDQVEIVLREPSLTAPSGELTLRNGKVAVTAAAEPVLDEQGARLVGVVPRDQLTDGTWTLTLVSAEAGPESLGVRLLVQGDRPLVLLWGAARSKSRLPDPRPASAGSSQVTAAAGRLLDKALSALPPERALHIRRTTRRAARRVLGPKVR